MPMWLVKCLPFCKVIQSFNLVLLHLVLTDETDPKKLYKDSNVYASNLKWVPWGNQKDWFPCAAEALYPDILLAKMLPGHEIDLRCLCYKGLFKLSSPFIFNSLKKSS